MKNAKLLINICLLLFVFAACKKTGPGENPASGHSGILKGTIFSPNGTVPIASVIVETTVNGSNKTTTSDKEGKFALELPGGEYDVKMYTGAGIHFSAQKRFKVEAGKTTEIPGAQTKLSFAGKIAYVPGSFDAIQELVHEMGVPTTELELNDLQDFNVLKQYDVLLLNCGAGHMDLNTDQAVERFLKAGGSVYASDWELSGLSMQEWGFVPENLLAYNREGEKATIEGNILYEPFKKAIGKDKITIEFDMPGYVQITHFPANDQRFKVLVNHPQKGALAMNIQWGPAKTTAAGISYGGNIVYTTFHDASSSNEVKALLRQMILML